MFRLTSSQIAQACRGVLTEEDCAEIEGLDPDGAVSLASVFLINAGIDNPFDFLKEKGLID